MKITCRDCNFEGEAKMKFNDAELIKAYENRIGDFLLTYKSHCPKCDSKNVYYDYIEIKVTV